MNEYARQAPGLDDARAQVLNAPPAEELDPVTVESFTEFDFNLQTNRLHVVGYSPAEVSDLLSLYRDHLRLMSDFAQSVNDVMRSGS